MVLFYFQEGTSFRYVKKVIRHGRYFVYIFNDFVNIFNGIGECPINDKSKHATNYLRQVGVS